MVLFLIHLCAFCDLCGEQLLFRDFFMSEQKEANLLEHPGASLAHHPVW